MKIDPETGVLQHGRCKDCKAEGISTLRPAPFPGPRCTTHHRVVVKTRKARQHERRVQDVYGLAPGDYDRLLAIQNGLCAICGPVSGRKGGTRRLSVDHDHVTGHVRGLLCMSCNDILGLYHDDPNVFIRGARYLLNPPAQDMERLQ